MTAERRFVGEPLAEIEPLDASVMAAGQPSAPGSFRWRDETYRTKHVLSVWKDISDGSTMRRVMCASTGSGCN